MSSLVFPAALPYAYSVFKVPTWATRTQRAVSGRELTITDYVNPIWNFRLTFEVLRDRSVNGFTSEIRKLIDFFLQMRGAYDTFLFVDPTDFSVTDESIGTGDGVETEFQLVRRFYASGFVEDIIAPTAIVNVKIAGTPTVAYTLDSATGIITFTSAPANAAAITASFTYYFRCRFMMDAAEFENFMSLRWRLAELRFKSVIL
jgi:uncharacterized protein (TIGR02217 family)